MGVSRPTEEKAWFARQLAERDATIAALRATLATLEGTIAALQSTLINHANELSLLRRRLYGAKSERGGTSELQLLLGNLLEDKRKVSAALEEAVEGTAAAGDETTPSGTAEASCEDLATPSGPPPAADNLEQKPAGRRDLWNTKVASCR